MNNDIWQQVWHQIRGGLNTQVWVQVMDVASEQMKSPVYICLNNQWRKVYMQVADQGRQQVCEQVTEDIDHE